MIPNPRPRDDASGDADLARRIAGGDRDAFLQMMRRYNRTLYRTARSILRDDGEAEDAVQEAYLLAYRSIGGFRADARLSTWLVRIVANEALARLRKRQRRGDVVPLRRDDDDDTHEDSRMSDTPQQRPDVQAFRAELRRLLEAKIDRLPDAFRTVFILRGVEELSVDEVASSLGIPAATVRTRYLRARHLLQESLSQDVDLDVDDLFAFDGERCDRIVAAVLARLAAP